MAEPATPLLVPALAGIYGMLAPCAEALLRAATGLALVPHGLRMTFGLFPDTGLKVRNLDMLAVQLDQTGWRPGRLWAPAIAVVELLCGPLLALGLFTRPAAAPVFLFLLAATYERWRAGGYFWNTQGLEYTLLWTIAAFYFLVHGGGLWSLDHLVIGRAL